MDKYSSAHRDTGKSAANGRRKSVCLIVFGSLFVLLVGKFPRRFVTHRGGNELFRGNDARSLRARGEREQERAEVAPARTGEGNLPVSAGRYVSNYVYPFA